LTSFVLEMIDLWCECLLLLLHLISWRINIIVAINDKYMQINICLFQILQNDQVINNGVQEQTDNERFTLNQLPTSSKKSCGCWRIGKLSNTNSNSRSRFFIRQPQRVFVNAIRIIIFYASPFFYNRKHPLILQRKFFIIIWVYRSKSFFIYMKYAWKNYI